MNAGCHRSKYPALQEDPSKRENMRIITKSARRVVDQGYGHVTVQTRLGNVANAALVGSET